MRWSLRPANGRKIAARCSPLYVTSGADGLSFGCSVRFGGDDGGDVGAVAGVEAALDVGEVGADGGGFESELVGDFGVGVTLGDEVGDLSFAGGEACQAAGSGRGGVGCGEVEESLPDIGVDVLAAVVVDAEDGCGEVVGVAGFEEEAVGAGVEGVEDVGVGVEGGEDDDLEVGVLA